MNIGTRFTLCALYMLLREYVVLARVVLDYVSQFGIDSKGRKDKTQRKQEINDDKRFPAA